MNKIRVEHKTHFVILANRTVRDARLSWKARGILAYLLSLPDGALVGRAEIARSGPDGEWVVRGALKELVSAGYLKRRTVRGERGRLVTETVLVEVPALSTGAEESPVVDFQPPVTRAEEGSPVVDFPPGGGPPPVRPGTMDETAGGTAGWFSTTQREVVVGRNISVVPLRDVLSQAVADSGGGSNNGGEGSAQRPEARPAPRAAPHRDRLALRLWERFPELEYDDALGIVNELRSFDVADNLIDEGIGYCLEREDIKSPRFLVVLVTDWARQRASHG